MLQLLPLLPLLLLLLLAINPAMLPLLPLLFKAAAHSADAAMIPLTLSHALPP